MALAYTSGGFGVLIQSITREGVTIVWFTTTQDNSRVKLGTTAGNLNMTYSDTALSVLTSDGTYKHTMKIRGLLPNTKYFYSVGSTTNTWFGNTSNEFFHTAADLDTAQPMRFWALADYGDGSGNQLTARNAFATFNGTTKIDLWLGIGDLAYGSGCWSEISGNDFARYPNQYKQYPHFVVPGNHDHYCSNLQEYNEIYVLPTLTENGGIASRTKEWYSFDYGNVHIIGYNSYITSYMGVGTPFYKWLTNDLENWAAERDAGRKKWCIVFTHYPAYSHGTHDSDGTGDQMGNNRTIINPLLETYNVDLVLYGHSHVYERSYFMKGFFGDSNTFSTSIYPIGDVVQAGLGNPTPYDKRTGQQGTVYITNGWGGASSCSTCQGSWPHLANIAYQKNIYGSTVIDFNTPVGGVQTMRVRAVGGSNAVVYDDFSIIK